MTEATDVQQLALPLGFTKRNEYEYENGKTMFYVILVDVTLVSMYTWTPTLK